MSHCCRSLFEGDIVVVGDDDNEDVALLQVALRRRRERAGAEEPQQRGFNALVAVAAVRAMTRDTGKLIQTRKARIDADVFAKTFKECVANAGDNAILGHASPAMLSMAVRLTDPGRRTDPKRISYDRVRRLLENSRAVKPR